MAQHIIVNIEDAPKIKKSVERVTGYLAKSWNRSMLEREACMGNWLPVYQKEVLPFSKAFSKDECEYYGVKYDDHFYVAIRSYDIKPLFEDGAELTHAVEVIADKRGGIVKCLVAI